MLKIFYPQAIAWYDGIEGHVYTEIDGRYYDIDGEHQFNNHWYQLSIEPEIEKQADKWINNDLIIKV